MPMTYMDTVEYHRVDGYPDPNERFPSGEPRGWGFFGYPSAMVDLALSRDDDKALSEMMEHGFVNKDSETSDQLTMRECCEKRKASKCAMLFA